MNTRETKQDPRRRRRPRRLVTALLILLAAVSLACSAEAAQTAAEAASEPPVGFRDLLSDPRVAEALVWEGAWEDGTGPRPYSAWDAGHRADLHRALVARELGRALRSGDPAVAERLEDGRWLSPEAAWRVYLAHAAHALWVELHRQVAWSLRSLTPDQIALLLDGRNLLELDPAGDRYAFGPAGAVAVWRPEVVFAFLRHHELLAASQEETVYSLADWARRAVRPRPPSATEPVPEALPSVVRLLEETAAARPSLAGCHALSGLLAAGLRSANVPVRVAESPFAHRGEEAVRHSRLELPTLGRGLVHSSELHAHLVLPSGNSIPTGALFATLGWIRDHVESPRHLDCADGSCHTAAEQALFNSARRLLALAATHLPDGLLIDRASDASVTVPPERLFDTLASGCSEAPGGAFVRPLFEDAERREIARRADQEIERAGGGDWARGAETVRQRWQRVLENR